MDDLRWKKGSQSVENHVGVELSCPSDHAIEIQLNQTTQKVTCKPSLSLYLQGISIFGKPCWSEGTSGSLSIMNDWQKEKSTKGHDLKQQGPKNKHVKKYLSIMLEDPALRCRAWPALLCPALPCPALPLVYTFENMTAEKKKLTLASIPIAVF